MRKTSLLLALALMIAACTAGGGVSPPSGDASAAAADDSSVAVDAANGEVVIEQVPRRIVSLSPTATEILFAIGADAQVVGVDEYSNYPQEAPTTALSGFQPNVEAIAGFDPDLVIVSDDLNDVVASLDAIQVPVIQQPAAQSLEDTYIQIEQLGTATGNVESSAALVAEMRGEVEALLDSLPAFGEPPTYYHELNPSLFSLTSETFIGEMYSLAGLENIADGADEAASRYPQLSAEFIIDADPDLIFLADTRCCGQTAEAVAARPGWDRTTAVRTDGVIALDDDIASRWGPRLVDLLRSIVEAVLRLATGG